MRRKGNRASKRMWRQLSTETKSEESLADQFRTAASAVFFASVGWPLYFLIARDWPSFLFGSVVASVLFLLRALFGPGRKDLDSPFRTEAEASAPRTSQARWSSSRIAYFAANALTMVRPGLGVAAGIAMLHGNVTHGFLLYFFGLLSDVLDGLIARMFAVQSPSGRKWDAVADAILNASFGFGLAWLAIHPVDVPRLTVLCAMVVAFAVSRLTSFIGEHSVASKCLSGLWRVILFALAYSLLPSDWRMAALFGGGVLATIGGIYEIGVTRKEIRDGVRVRWR